MGDKHDTYVTAWSSAQERELLQKGWTQVGRVYLHENDENPDYTCRPVLAPPEPTLVARMRDWAKRAPILSDEEFANDQHVVDTLEAADVLERIGELLAGRGEARRERDG